MGFSEWIENVIRALKHHGVARIAMTRDDFSVLIANYWDGVTAEDQASRLVA